MIPFLCTEIARHAPACAASWNTSPVPSGDPPDGTGLSRRRRGFIAVGAACQLARHDRTGAARGRLDQAGHRVRAAGPGPVDGRARRVGRPHPMGGSGAPADAAGRSGASGVPLRAPIRDLYGSGRGPGVRPPHAGTCRAPLRRRVGRGVSLPTRSDDAMNRGEPDQPRPASSHPIVVGVHCPGRRPPCRNRWPIRPERRHAPSLRPHRSASRPSECTSCSRKFSPTRRPGVQGSAVERIRRIHRINVGSSSARTAVIVARKDSTVGVGSMPKAAFAADESMTNGRSNW